MEGISFCYKHVERVKNHTVRVNIRRVSTVRDIQLDLQADDGRDNRDGGKKENSRYAKLLSDGHV